MTIKQIVHPSVSELKMAVELLNEIFSKFPGHSPYEVEETFRRLSESEDPVAFIVMKDDQAVGFALCYQRYPGYFHL
jgi:hypothetical protein